MRREVLAFRSRRAGRHGHAVRSEDVTCPVCADLEVDGPTSFLVHSDPDRHPGVDAEMLNHSPEPSQESRARPSWSRGEIVRRGTGWPR